MWTWLLGKPTMILGLVVAGLIALAVISRNWSCKPVKPPRPPISQSFEVVDVPTGNQIIVKAGLLGKQIRTVTLADIVAEGIGSQANLERLASKSIRVETPHHGLFRATDVVDNCESEEVVCSECNGTGKLLDAKEMMCPLCNGQGCKTCKQSGKIKLNWFTIARCQLWMSSHIDRSKCKECTDTTMCPVAEAKINEILDNQSESEPQEVQCSMCEGSGKLYILTPLSKKEIESRAPIVGVVFGETGACLNLAQVMDGWATCLPTASKDWKKQEAIAKKNKLGIWK
jgi:hypothetical protein